MKIKYTFQEAYLALGIDAKTLRSWIRQANIVVGEDENDRRCRVLLREQVELLAVEHKRTLPEDLKEKPTLDILNIQVRNLKNQLEKLTIVVQKQDRLITGLQKRLDEMSKTE